MTCLKNETSSTQVHQLQFVPLPVAFPRLLRPAARQDVGPGEPSQGSTVQFAQVGLPSGLCCQEHPP
eukprot:COSAG01_NODE_40024_length_468_cov_5.181572_1_plen_66_part_10